MPVMSNDLHGEHHSSTKSTNFYYLKDCRKTLNKFLMQIERFPPHSAHDYNQTLQHHHAADIPGHFDIKNTVLDHTICEFLSSLTRRKQMLSMHLQRAGSSRARDTRPDQLEQKLGPAGKTQPFSDIQCSLL